MNPVFFGSSKKRLYGVYHPALGSVHRDEGVVLCYPMGQEYMRAHRAFRQLALLLSKRGYHVLRFDYYATGDSAGEAAKGSVRQWVEDIGAAIEELKDTAEVDRVTLVGLRLGGALAAMATSGRDDIERLVLWDPVSDGRSYVDEILAATADGDSGQAADQLRDEGLVGIHGFPLTRSMAEELAGIDLIRANGVAISARRVYLVVSAKDDGFRGLDEALGRRHPDSTRQCIPSPGNWNEVDNFGSALLPQEIIHGIVTWMS